MKELLKQDLINNLKGKQITKKQIKQQREEA